MESNRHGKLSYSEVCEDLDERNVVRQFVCDELLGKYYTLEDRLHNQRCTPKLKLNAAIGTRIV